MPYNDTMREEEVKNRLRQDYFRDYDAAPILGNVDFAVAVPHDGPQLFETEYLLWAESKKGTQADIYESFVQLILTIGKARTFDHHLPPAFLGAFDAEKIAFIPYNAVLDIFYQNDFNWKVTPSDHTTREFQQVMGMVRETLDENILLFRFAQDDRELRRFISRNFIVGKSRLSKIRINKNNFTAIYQKWLAEVKPTIVVNWEAAKKRGIIDADFYLADILSEHNVTLKEKLFVLLRKDYYELDRKIDEMGFFNSSRAQFSDEQKAHTQFWNRYNRPPKREYWEYIVTRRDLLVPQDVRERKGSFFTPRQWVELSQEYLAAELGEDWQDEYTVWDCCAGTGNLLAGLTNKWNIWASTLDKADVDVMHDRIRNGAALLDSHVFQFDFLNDPFDKLPPELKKIIDDPEQRKKLVIYINPPYAEAGDSKQRTGTGKNKSGVAFDNYVYRKYRRELGLACRELFAQFFVRIYQEIPSSILAEFSTLKLLQAPNFSDFRKTFQAKISHSFIVPADSFDNVKGQFPIGFFIWRTSEKVLFDETITNIYDSESKFIGNKLISSYLNDTNVIAWLRRYYDKSENPIGYLRMNGTNVQNNIGIYITSKLSDNDLHNHFYAEITTNNVTEMCIYMAIRQCIPATWINDREQYLVPNDKWINDLEFRYNCLAFSLFDGQNRISSQYGVNHWIPFTEAEVDAKEKFASHFMSDYIRGKHRPTAAADLFGQPAEAGPLRFSEEAQAVMDAGRELWRYYHAQEGAVADASFYDIRLHFQGTKTTKSGKQQMNPDSADQTYTALLRTLRQALKTLATRIQPKIYEYGFLKQ